MMSVFKPILSALLLSSFVMTTAPALALSCMPFSIEDAYKRAAASKERYLAVHGVLTFDAHLMPDSYVVDAPSEILIPARIKGEFMTSKGFYTPISTAVTLKVECAGPWCGGARNNTDYLAFLREAGNSYELLISPCASDAFSTPSKKDLETILQCHTGGPCEASN